MKDFSSFMTEADDPRLQAVDTSRVAMNISNILRRLDVPFSKVEGKYQPVFGGAELQFRVDKAVIDGVKLSKFVFVVWTNGDITANASGGGLKHLVTMKRVGNIKTLSKLEDRTGIFQKIISFTVDEIKDTLRMRNS